MIVLAKIVSEKLAVTYDQITFLNVQSFYLATRFEHVLTYENLNGIFSLRMNDLKEAGFIGMKIDRCFTSLQDQNEDNYMCGEKDVSSGEWHGRVVVVTPYLIQFANMD